MPHLSFQLTSANLTFEGAAESDEWSFVTHGKLRDVGSFIIKNSENIFDGVGAEAIVYVEKRPPRSEMRGLPTEKPFDKNDEYRDTIHVTCPESMEDKPFFTVSISLPPDAYQRLIDTDWTKTILGLTVETSLMERAFIYGNNPNGSEIEWLADKQPYVFLEKVMVHFMSATEQGDLSR